VVIEQTSFQVALVGVVAECQKISIIGRICGSPIRSHGSGKLGSRGQRTRWRIERHLPCFVVSCLSNGFSLPGKPWALHRGSPNLTDTPSAMVTIRYVHRWYADDSRDVGSIPRTVWESMTKEQQSLMRFAVSPE
jgi:hypothetical protein